MSDERTTPEPLSIRLDGIGDDSDLLEGYVGVDGRLAYGVTLIASGGVDGEEVVKLTRDQARWLRQWLGEVLGDVPSGWEMGDELDG